MFLFSVTSLNRNVLVRWFEELLILQSVDREKETDQKG